MITILCMVLFVEPGTQPAATHKAADVELIANWLSGKDTAKAFTKTFGDRKILAGSKKPLLYTDIPGVKAPASMKAVNYQFVQARMSRIRNGHRAAPAVLIVRSSLEEPAEDEPGREINSNKGKPGDRVYYVEVAIGNSAWHWLKVVVRDEDGKPKAQVLWTEVS